LSVEGPAKVSEGKTGPGEPGKKSFYPFRTVLKIIVSVKPKKNTENDGF